MVLNRTKVGVINQRLNMDVNRIIVEEVTIQTEEAAFSQSEVHIRDLGGDILVEGLIRMEDLLDEVLLAVTHGADINLEAKLQNLIVGLPILISHGEEFSSVVGIVHMDRILQAPAE